MCQTQVQSDRRTAAGAGWKIIMALMAVALSAAAQPESVLLRNFDAEPPGSAPAGIRFDPEAGGKWVVRQAKEGGRVVSQEALLQGNGIAVVEGPKFGDLSVSAKVIGTSGRRVQGIIWRYHDNGNFYLTRAEGGDPEGRVVPEIRTDVYYKGKRIQLGGKVRVPGLDVTQWFHLKVEHRGSVISMFLNGRKVAELDDDYWCTLLPGAGLVGFYTMRGTTAQFDELAAHPIAAK